MKSLQNKLNFKVDLIPSKDGSWGALKEDGSWTGMVGMVANGEADICGAALSFSSSRAQASILFVIIACLITVLFLLPFRFWIFPPPSSWIQLQDL